MSSFHAFGGLRVEVLGKSGHFTGRREESLQGWFMNDDFQTCTRSSRRIRRFGIYLLPMKDARDLHADPRFVSCRARFHANIRTRRDSRCNRKGR